MKDSYRHKGLRKRLVKTIEKKGFKNQKVLDAIGKIPRHLFLDDAFDEWAYKDRAFSIGMEQTISQPYTVAVQTDLLGCKPGDKVLELGTGSGYQAAILAELGYRVYTIERIEQLYRKSTALLRSLGYSAIRTYYRDGHLGLPQHAPYHGIIVTAAAQSVPNSLLNQLAIGGNLVIPIGDNKIQTMIQIKRTGENNFKRTSHGKFSFVPFLPGISDD